MCSLASSYSLTAVYKCSGQCKTSFWLLCACHVGGTVWRRSTTVSVWKGKGEPA